MQANSRQLCLQRSLWSSFTAVVVSVPEGGHCEEFNHFSNNKKQSLANSSILFSIFKQKHVTMLLLFFAASVKCCSLHTLNLLHSLITPSIASHLFTVCSLVSVEWLTSAFFQQPLLLKLRWRRQSYLTVFISGLCLCHHTRMHVVIFRLMSQELHLGFDFPWLECRAYRHNRVADLAI